MSLIFLRNKDIKGKGNRQSDVSECECECKCEFYRYLDKRYLFNKTLKDKRDVACLILIGNVFQTSGPWWRIVLWAIISLGFVKWKSDECRVGYEWMSLL